MKFNKIIALVLCAVVLMGIFTGCGKKVDEVIEGYTNTTGRDTATGRDSFDGDEVVMTVDGEDITWNEFFDMICYSTAEYESTYGPVTDFSQGTGTGTMSDVIKDSAVHYIRLFKAVEDNAKKLGVDYPSDIEAQFAASISDGIKKYGSEEGLNAFIADYYGSRDNYKYTFKLNSLYDLIFNKLYGEGGSNLTDEQIEENSTDYIMAKHILLETVDDEGNELDEAAKEKAKATAEEVLRMLKDYTGDDLEGYFDELMNQYSEDGGAATYPDGYLFAEGDMVEQFYEAAKNLEIGEISDIVESEYGYHIIMRLPINRQSVPLNFARYGMNYSMAQIVANNLFSDEFNGWAEATELVKTPLYDQIDLANVFPAEELENE